MIYTGFGITFSELGANFSNEIFRALLYLYVIIMDFEREQTRFFLSGVCALEVHSSFSALLILNKKWECDKTTKNSNTEMDVG